MGYSGKIKLRTQASKLRKKGYSVRSIQKKLGVSKSSVSLWTRDILLTAQQVNKLEINRKKAGLKGSLVSAKKKMLKRINETKKIMNDAKNEVGKLSSREKFLIGITLYFAEGDKAGHNVAFTNSDSKSIKFMIDWFRNYCNVKEEKIRCYIYLHDNLNEKKAKSYWAQILRISINQFGKTYIVNNNNKSFRKTKHIYGICRISISDVKILRRILGWISGVFNV